MERKEDIKDGKDKVKRKSSGAGGFLKLPKSMIKFTKSKSSSSDMLDSTSGMEISGVFDAKKNISFSLNNAGQIDMSTVPPEYKKIVENLYEHISAPKFISTRKVGNHGQSSQAEGQGDEDEVIRRHGPRVEKNLKESEILDQMRGLVIEQSPWKSYKKVGFSHCFDNMLHRDRYYNRKFCLRV